MEVKTEEHITRVLGKYTNDLQGATVLCIAGVHGNEPSGVEALKRVFEYLEKEKPTIKGQFVGLLGNITALAEGERYVDEDMNRIWTGENLDKYKASEEPPQKPESVEQLEFQFLLKNVTDVINNSSGDVFLVDLHTTSSESQPFISIDDTLRNRAYALKFPMPIVLGLEEELDGTLLNYINKLGHVSLCVEGGQHDEASSVENLLASVWLALFNSECIDPVDIPESYRYYDILAKNTLIASKIYEVRYRHPIEHNEKFQMKPGFVNFQPIKRNQGLAIKDDVVINAPESGRIFMPLYQKKGEDGFFVIREINMFWLRVSKYLRKLKIHGMLHYLPGVRRLNRNNNILMINKRIARWYVIELFHLLGYRRKFQKDNHIIFMKREYDVESPKSLRI